MVHTKRATAAALALFLHSGVSMAANDVRVDGGLVAGASGDIQVYKGIPFAAPPVGDNRWRAPQPVQPWSGVRAADQFGAACTQTPAPSNALFFQATFAGPEIKTDEDCLYLNVWTPARSPQDRLPVMVWIYGGGYRVGWGHQSAYTGEGLARKGVIVVTFNYRLGLLGFFAHPELTKESGHNASGNYGVMDMVAALEWVQRNIGAFGGDPSNVTVFGESGGSTSVNLLMASPRAKGLFHRAIGQSIGNFAGVFGPMPSLAAAEQAGLKLGETLKAESIADLRAKPAMDIYRGLQDRPQPIVDGWLLPEDVDAVFSKGTQNDVPLLIGSNSDEGTPYGQPGDPQKYTEQIKGRYGARADAYLQLYPASTPAEVRDANNAAITDSWFGWQIWKWARAQQQTGKSPVYVYWFDRAPPLPDRDFLEWPRPARFGAFHSGEIVYAMNNLNTRAWPWEDVDRRLSDVMSSYWTNFARSGNPNGAGLPAWPMFSSQQDSVMHLGERIQPGPLMHKPALEFFDAVFRR